jgi:NAD(P)-dependent dehydrogenase (short-subunit alcohol dehydrogenase family)
MSVEPDVAGSSILVIGTGGIAVETVRQATAAGASFVLGGRTGAKLTEAAERAGARPEPGDLSDESSAVDLARRLKQVDHVVTLPAAPANRPLAELTRADLISTFDAKVFGATLLAGRLSITGSLTLFSGLLAWRPAVERTAMVTANGAVAFLAQALAVELAPVRVNATSPGDRRLRLLGRAGGGEARLPGGCGGEEPHGVASVRRTPWRRRRCSR